MRNIIIICAALLFLGHGAYLAFNGWFFRPDMVIIVRFKEVPPLIKFAGDVGVYYRGYKVGKATCKNLSSDQQYILFCLEINYKGLKLPVNTKIILKTQDIFGDRYFDLVYPENPSEELVADGDIIDGTAVYERVDKYLVEQMESGELGALISDLAFLAGGARSMLGGKQREKFEEVQGELTESAEDLSYITKELKTILADPRTKKDIKEVLSYAPKALKTVNELLAAEEFRTTIKQAPDLLGRTVTGIETVNVGIEGVNKRLDITNPLLCDTNRQLGTLNPKIPVIPQELITQTDRTLRRYDCIGKALSETMSKNCLFFRFMFGKPGEPFEDCINVGPGCYYCPQSIR